MGIYSHSKLSTFEQCPLKFKFKYIDKLKPEFEMSIEAHLGKTVHDALEWLYIMILEKKPTPTIDQLIIYYAETWQQTFSPEIKIIKNDLTEKDYFNKGVKFLIDYHTTHHPFDDGTLECEKKVLIDVHGYTLQGFIDRLVFNKEAQEYEIHDYKTANFLPTQESFDQDRQLALYSIAIQELMGTEKICLTWHYLAHNTKIISKRTKEQLEKLKKEIKELIEQIESTKEFPARESVLCDWCEFKYVCHAFGNKPPEKQKDLNNYSEEKIEELDIFG